MKKVKENMLKTNKFWIAIIAGVVCAAIIALLFMNDTPLNTAYIYSGGELIETIDLRTISDNLTITVDTGLGINIIEAETGRIRVMEANCADGICVRQGWVSSGRIPIVCLPHNLVITIENNSDIDIDGVVG